MACMDIEVFEVVDFLAHHQPFSELPGHERVELAQEMTIRYFRRGSVIIELGQRNDCLFLIRSGAVDILDDHGLLIDRNATGDTFGTLSLMSQSPSPYKASAIEDTLVLVLPGARFVRLFEQYRVIADHFAPRQRGRLRRATEQLHETSSSILRLSARDLITRAPVTASPTISIRDAARLMTDERVSALLLTDEDRLRGIVTDRDLRSRVTAQGAQVDAPISTVMTSEPVTVGPDTLAFELLMVMTSRRVHHLPVVVGQRVIGLVSAGDLMRLETSNPAYLVGDIAKQPDISGVAQVVQRAPRLAGMLLAQGAEADDVSAVLTAIADAATARLIELAVQELGPAPGGWCWVALGSQARRELALGSDQDHALIISDDAHDLSWYQALAQRVVDGLATCGYPRCEGEAMASKWCMTLDGWRRQFSQWLSAPESEAILHSQIFFDMRAVSGDASLHTTLRDSVVTMAQQSSRFLAHMAAMAVRREPPVGFFRGFVVEKSGEHRDKLDLKAGGLHAVIEAVRTMALAQGVTEAGTAARIRALQEAGQLGQEQAADLLDGFHFIALLRIRHHAELAARGERPDNFINPDHLTATQRRHLREAFGVIRRTQTALTYRHQTHLMN